MRRTRKPLDKADRAVSSLVEKQLDSNDPPEVRQALDRLLGRGMNRDQAVEMLGMVVISEFYDTAYLGRPADKARYMNMAEGSLEESRYYLILAQDLGYGDTAKLAGTLEEISRLLNAYATAILTSIS